MSLVIAIQDLKARQDIEQYAREHTFPNVIQFIEDVQGNWIVPVECLSDSAYVPHEKVLGELTKVQPITYAGAKQLSEPK